MPAAPSPVTHHALALAAAAVVALAAPPADAQSWRTLESSRQLRDSGRVQVRVEYGAGRLALAPTSEPVLYRMDLRFDAERDTPIHQFDPALRRLHVGVRPGKSRFLHDRSGDLRLELPRGVPLELELGLGAARGTLDLRGLTLDRVRLETGASDTRVLFDSTTRPMREIHVSAGVGQVALVDVASAAPRDVRVEVGVGGVEVDLGRVWRDDVDLTLESAVGSATIRVPRDVGVRVELERALSGFSHDGLTRRGDGVWVSDNWDGAAHRLRVRAETALGKFRVERY